MSSCSGISGWDDSHWSDRLGLSYESRGVSAYESVRSGDSPGLVTWLKDDGAWMDGACRDPQYGTVSGDVGVGPEEMRLMLRSACPSEYGACVAEASCSEELSVGLVSDAAVLVDGLSALFESLTDCYAMMGGRRLQQMGCLSLSDAESCAMGGCEWDGVSCRPDCSFTSGDPSTCGSGCIYTARVDGCMDCVAGKYGTVVGSCLLYTSPSPRDRQKSRMPSSA